MSTAASCMIVSSVASGWVFCFRPDGSTAQHLRHEREVKFWHVRRQLGHLPLPPRRIDERARVSSQLLLVPLLGRRARTRSAQ